MRSLPEIQSSLQKFGTKNPYHLFSEPYQALANTVARNITSNLSIAEIANLVTLIESIKLRDTRLWTLIDQGGGMIISEYADKSTGLPAKAIDHFFDHAHRAIDKVQPNALSPKKHSTFIDTMVKLHDMLLTLMERSLLKANTSVLSPEVTFEYRKAELQTAQALQDIEKQSKEASLPDSNILADIGRSVTFDNKIFKGSKEEICAEIEKFAGDSISNTGSIANKIFNFGGQFLYGILLNEFSVSTEFNGQKVQPQINRGKINWRKTTEGKIEANIEVKVFSVKVQGDNYILNTQGTGLAKISLDQERGEEIMKNLQKETKSVPCLRVPIGAIKVTVELTGNYVNYYLKTTKAELQYNTNNLTCISQPKTSLEFITPTSAKIST